MPVWTITRFDGKPMSGFVVGLGGTAKAKRTFPTAKAADRGWKMIQNRDPKGFEAGEYTMTEVRNLKDHLELDSECPALVAGVKASPMEDTAQRVLADRLTELGIAYNRAYREAHQIALNSMNPCLWPSADVEKLLKGVKGGASRVRRLLDAANGTRRARTLSMAAVLRECHDVRRTLKIGGVRKGWRVLLGGSTSRAGSTQTICIIAVASNGNMRLAIGSTPSNWGWHPVSLTMIGTAELSEKAVRDEWVNRDDVAVWSTGVGAQNVTRLC